MTVKTIGLKIVIVFLFLCNLYAQDKTQSTISVSGTGTVLVQPDMVQITISLNKTEKTTQLAQQEVSKMVRRVLAILKENKIEDKNISTALLRLKPEYDYKLSKRVLVGQRAEQIITFSIDDINTDDEKVSKIIDSLVQINGLELNRLSYDTRNNTEYSIKSRELAFWDASKKAAQYAELSNLKIVKVLNISEENTRQYPLVSDSMFYRSQGVGFAPDTSTILPPGEMEITTRVIMVFLLE
jgi:uncharacterized protein YggE